EKEKEKEKEKEEKMDILQSDLKDLSMDVMREWVPEKRKELERQMGIEIAEEVRKEFKKGVSNQERWEKIFEAKSLYNEKFDKQTTPADIESVRMVIVGDPQKVKGAPKDVKVVWDDFWEKGQKDGKVNEYNKTVEVEMVQIETESQLEIARNLVKEFSPEVMSGKPGAEPRVEKGDWLVIGNGGAAADYIVPKDKQPKLYQAVEGKQDTFKQSDNREAMLVKAADGPVAVYVPWQEAPLLSPNGKDVYITRMGPGDYNLVRAEDFEATFSLVKEK
ncbi:hypothetical protein, partial [Bacillus sp. 196mf]|uniref:hypothetical protein n=1 Tax=Bacillus sp. 196mf TaxID=1761754 RepID=UPI000D847113